VEIRYHDTHAVDLDQLEALFLTAGWDRRSDRARLAQQVEGARYVVWAADGEKLVGFARAISDGASNAYVSTVVVAPGYRGRGIGKELIIRLMEGKDNILFVLHSRPEVLSFYLKCGFEHATDMLRRPRKW
jgi:ribosomal protein S18 acetylase RimI-like enzyme